ncbi:hypothetical protein ACFSSC_02030 [Corynebacterium mendelii]|uniref:Uncharacterized protein n=1 Tax=Corynebacterium mendelii TaxID=2765362 RepID=A0A939IVB4_9CORY|nr:hypothetical protein [Corynebacterium mendelii]MBN9644061.1 hypothetical protein [Corynebacterium mendelii]
MTAPKDKPRSDTIYALAALTVGTIAGTNPGDSSAFHNRLGQDTAATPTTDRAAERAAASVVVNAYRSAYAAADPGARRPGRRGL